MNRPNIQFFSLFGASMIFGVPALWTSGWIAMSCLFIAIVLFWVSIWRRLNASNIRFPRIKKCVHWIHAQTLELFAFIAILFLRLVTLFRKNKVTPSSQSRPILLVHGYFNGEYVWEYHKNYLEKNGLGPIYTMNLGFPFLSIRSYALKVQKKAQEIAEETGRSDLILVGHSMGGLVNYYYVSKLARAYSVPKVITIGSPLQGTRVAKIGLGRCAREMQIDSDLINEVKDAVGCCTDVRFHNIATRVDELVIPCTSGILKSESSDQMWLDDIGHASLLFSKRVADQLCQWIKDS